MVSVRMKRGRDQHSPHRAARWHRWSRVPRKVPPVCDSHSPRTPSDASSPAAQRPRRATFPSWGDPGRLRVDANKQGLIIKRICKCLKQLWQSGRRSVCAWVLQAREAIEYYAYAQLAIYKLHFTLRRFFVSSILAMSTTCELREVEEWDAALAVSCIPYQHQANRWQPPPFIRPHGTYLCCSAARPSARQSNGTRSPVRPLSRCTRCAVSAIYFWRVSHAILIYLESRLSRG